MVLLLVSTGFVGVSYNLEKSLAESFDDKTFYVGGSGPGNYTRIQQAVDIAKDGDTIFVYSGVYNENVFVNKALKILGEDKNHTFIRGTFASPYITLYLRADNITIRGFTISGNDISIRIFGEDYNIKNIYIYDCRITNDRAGIETGGDLIKNIKIEKCYFYPIHIDEDMVIKFKADEVIDLTIVDCCIELTYIYMDNMRHVLVNNCDFIKSGISAEDISDYVTISNCTFGTQSKWSSAIFIKGSYQLIENCSIKHQSEAIIIADTYGGIIRNCIIEDNRENAINFYRSSNIVIERCTIRNNDIGIIPSGKNITIRDCRIENNKVGIQIGIGKTRKNFVVKNCHIENNDIALLYRIRTIGHKYLENNFISNEDLFYNDHAFFIINYYKNNYWDDWIGIGPYHVYGFLNWDWNPVKEPYEIEV